MEQSNNSIKEQIFQTTLNLVIYLHHRKSCLQLRKLKKKLEKHEIILYFKWFYAFFPSLCCQTIECKEFLKFHISMPANCCQPTGNKLINSELRIWRKKLKNSLSI